MAKQRNSLGFLVFPVFEETLSWDEYKKRTGIDLESVFKIVRPSDSQYRIDFTDVSKLIAISYEEGGYGLPHVLIPSISIYVDSTPASANVTLNYRDGQEELGYHIIVYANKTIEGGII